MAQVITPPEDPADRCSSEEAREKLTDLLRRLEGNAPRNGLGAATGSFIDYLIEMEKRHGASLFVCYDHMEIPSTANEIERFFGASKAHVRRALAAASTANGVVHNLGADYLVAFALAWTRSRDELVDSTGRLSREQFIQARRAAEEAEAPARIRRSRRRFPRRHLERIYAAWEAGLRRAEENLTR